MQHLARRFESFHSEVLPGAGGGDLGAAQCPLPVTELQLIALCQPGRFRRIYNILRHNEGAVVSPLTLELLANHEQATCGP